MTADTPGGFRGFLRTRFGRIVLTLLIIGVVFATFAYVATVLAIPVFLIVGLGVPIWAGVKRPRFLALVGVIVLIVVAPLATVVFSQELLVAPGPTSSPGVGPWERGGSVLQNATVSPFSGSTSTTYAWSVDVYPRYLVSSLNGTNWTNDTVDLFISTCPGATGPNDANCSAGYSLVELSQRFGSRMAPANGTPVRFHDAIGSNAIWSWQMELVIQNTTNASNPYRIELSGDPTYNGIEGPIVGGFGTAYGALIGTIYEIELVYLGIPFYFLLVLYMWFKSREARRKQAIKRAAQAMVGSKAASPEAAGAAPAPGPAAAGEQPCPNCGAVVYPKESTCWKCGSALGGPPSSGAPLPDTKSGPGS